MPTDQQINHLISSEEANPIEVFRRFFSDYHLEDANAMLGYMVEACITSDDPPYDTGSGSADLLLFERNLKRLFEAGYLIQKHNDQ